MTVTITTTPVPSAVPMPVQLVVAGIGSGEPYTVVGVAGTTTWPVPGGVGVGTGEQVALIDNRAPLNLPFVYRVVAGGQVYESAPLSVASQAPLLLTSLDGDITVEFEWDDDRAPRELAVRSATWDVPGRSRPPSRFAPGGDGAGSMRVRTSPEHSARLTALVQQGKPIVVRTDGTVRDLPAVELITITRASSELFDGHYADGWSHRLWSLSFVYVDDPQPSTVLSAWSWDDFDDAGLTWDQLDALALTWDEFDTYPWGQL